MRRILCRTGMAAILGLPAPLHAAVIQAESPARAHVQAAINAAADGDTVRIPAGSSTWTNAVNLSNKHITLQGAGMEQTVILDRTTHAIRVQGPGGKPFRITGLGFDGTGNPNSRSITLSNGRFIGFRVDNCRFYNERHALDFNSVQAAGVIDHCRFYSLEPKGGGDHVLIYASGDKSAAWQRPLGLGTADAIYVEDCTFEFFGEGNSDRPYLGMGKGARVVFRHNAAKNGCFEAFGASNYYTGTRATVFFEAYDNVFSGNCYCLFTIKGGTGNIFNNTVTGYGTGCFHFTDYRSRDYGTAPQYGPCDGMRAIDGNAPIEAGVHTGGDNQSVLTCAGSGWTPGQWVGYALWNETDDSVGRITANTADTITTGGGLKEGYTIVDSGTVTAVKDKTMTCAGKNWQWSGLKEFCYVRNVTDKSYGRITANGATTITATLKGGTRNAWQVGDVFQVTQAVPHGGVEKDWDKGDVFKITDGYPCLDQVGRAPDVEAAHVQPQLACPFYAWNNTVNGQNLNPWVKNGGVSPCGEQDHIQRGRDYFVDTPRPGYVPYTYPHPLTGGAVPLPAAPTNLRATGSRDGP
ncbi:MAG: hypothetical protein JXR37_36940 [Kiritimatiellae bacterium]|nr:hypothetical protein [Kiritimatiellia bacterium]